MQKNRIVKPKIRWKAKKSPDVWQLCHQALEVQQALNRIRFYQEWRKPRKTSVFRGFYFSNQRRRDSISQAGPKAFSTMTATTARPIQYVIIKRFHLFQRSLFIRSHWNFAYARSPISTTPLPPGALIVRPNAMFDDKVRIAAHLFGSFLPVF